MDSGRLSKTSYILGISAYYNDSAACIVSEGVILCAVQEESFSRKKFDSTFPLQSIIYCLEFAGIALADIDYIVFYEKPFLKFDRLLETCIARAPFGFRSFRAMLPMWIKERLFYKKLMLDEFRKIDLSADVGNRIVFTEYHHSLAANAFFTSPYEESAILTVGGVGEWATTTVSIGRGNQIVLKKSINYPHSLGLVYAAFASYLGFPTQEASHIIPHLARYGELRFVDQIRNKLFDIKLDGSFRINMRYFGFATSFTMTNSAFDNLFGGQSRGLDDEITQRHCDIAASIQHVIEDVMVSMVRDLSKDVDTCNLCLAGNLGASASVYHKILQDAAFKNVWIPFCVGDSAGAVGAALITYCQYLDNPRCHINHMSAPHLGPIFVQQNVQRQLLLAGAHFEILDEDSLIQYVAETCAAGKKIGWMRGRMEFGGHAFGSRAVFSCIPPKLDKLLFVTVVILPDVTEELRCSSVEQSYLTLAERKVLEHYHYSGHIDRILVADLELYPALNALLTAFKMVTGYSVLFQYDLAMSGEPMACTVEDAFRCFMGSDIDLLVVEGCLLHKEQQSRWLKIHPDALG